MERPTIVSISNKHSLDIGMLRRVKVFAIFVRKFAVYVGMVREVMVCLIALLLTGGIIISLVEKLEIGKAIYFAFVTGLTIGYGDITPETTIGRIVAILIGLTGMVFMGIVVGIATRSLADMHTESKPETGSLGRK